MVSNNDLLLSPELLLIAPFYGDIQSVYQEWLGMLSLYSASWIHWMKGRQMPERVLCATRNMVNSIAPKPNITHWHDRKCLGKAQNLWWNKPKMWNGVAHISLHSVKNVQNTFLRLVITNESTWQTRASDVPLRQMCPAASSAAPSRENLQRWRKVILPLCSALVRQLECWIQRWAPQ